MSELSWYLKHLEMCVQMETIVCKSTHKFIASGVEDLTRENAQLKAVIAEQKETIERLNDKQWELIGEKAPVLVAARKTIIEQSALIEKLGRTLELECEDVMDTYAGPNRLGNFKSTLAELTAWRKK